MLRVFFIACLVVPNFAFALSPDQECQQIAEVAAAVMQQRQDGVPYSTQQRISQEFSSEETKEFYMDIVEDAYTEKQLNTDTAKEQATQAFGKSYYDRCMAPE
ncbi:hypothetical protein N5J44_02310 [Acinetobacter ursingii]|uniref:Uncharacterized protein n=1 Tax=Acinetobacter ursingii TaxID=108980 RepID=A0AA46S9Q8_9GAMM|nr:MULTISPECIES: hypothetical protein [Acinetobacter]ENV77024.1 hypothetical protein F944_00882 [Acinetobacter ursingii DSM 16037 = CIP 107286]MCU4349867.1 hypothetical protein [Acinetobacter ursingii]MCU4359438.1 hypothetical protein [Acinetobacter ursingii]MCU4481531.1 hypothetical protein [Acinetobacter ursingii]MCU4490091.1 hypothetical protein [Acinetobacter ursingii]